MTNGGVVVHVGGWHHLVRAPEGGLRTLAVILDEAQVSWRGMLLGDRLPAPWAEPEPEESEQQDRADEAETTADPGGGDGSPAETPATAEPAEVSSRP